jgi:hypothetical protein
LAFLKTIVGEGKSAVVHGWFRVGDLDPVIGN